MKLKKYLLVFVIVVLAFGSRRAWADALTPSQRLDEIKKTDEWKQIKKGEEWKRYGIKGYMPQRCGTKTIIVDIGSMRLNVPHDDMRYRLLSNINEELDANEIDCDQKEIKDVFSFSTSVALSKGFGVSLILPKYYSNGEPKSTYEFWKKYLEKWMKEGTVTELINGTKKVQWGGIEEYLLSPNKAPTGNGEPVMIDCSGKSTGLTNFCTTSYIYPDGISMRFGYRFFRKDVPENDYLDFDLHWRQVYEAMKIKTSSPKIRGSKGSE